MYNINPSKICPKCSNHAYKNYKDQIQIWDYLNNELLKEKNYLDVWQIINDTDNDADNNVDNDAIKFKENLKKMRDNVGELANSCFFDNMEIGSYEEKLSEDKLKLEKPICNGSDKTYTCVSCRNRIWKWISTKETV